MSLKAEVILHKWAELAFPPASSPALSLPCSLPGFALLAGLLHLPSSPFSGALALHQACHAQLLQEALVLLRVP